MKCEDAGNKIRLYTELSADEVVRVDRHAATCESCRKMLRTMQNDQQILGQVFSRKELDHPLAFTSRVMAEIQLIDTKPEAHATGFGNLFTLFRMAMAAVSISLLVFFVYESTRPASPGISVVTSAMESGAVLNTSAFIQKLGEPDVYANSFFACMRNCKDAPNTGVCESCKDKIKNKLL